VDAAQGKLNKATKRAPAGSPAESAANEARAAAVQSALSRYKAHIAERDQAAQCGKAKGAAGLGQCRQFFTDLSDFALAAAAALDADALLAQQACAERDAATSTFRAEVVEAFEAKARECVAAPAKGEVNVPAMPATSASSSALPVDDVHASLVAANLEASRKIQKLEAAMAQLLAAAKPPPVPLDSDDVEPPMHAPVIDLGALSLTADVVEKLQPSDLPGIAAAWHFCAELDRYSHHIEASYKSYLINPCLVYSLVGHANWEAAYAQPGAPRKPDVHATHKDPKHADCGLMVPFAISRALSRALENIATHQALKEAMAKADELKVAAASRLSRLQPCKRPRTAPAEDSAEAPVVVAAEFLDAVEGEAK
jgi:hypothetical protein